MARSCIYCRECRVHPLWAYLARDGRIPNDKISNRYCYIGLSRHPFHRLCYNHNRKKGWKVGSKATKSIAPHWVPEMVIGPFMHGLQGERFKEQWRRGARQFRRRVRFGCSEAKSRSMTVYCRNTPLIKQMLYG